MSKKFSFYIFMGLVLLYVVVAMVTPTDPHVLARYHISETTAHLLSLTVVLPLAVIWMCAYYGYSRISDYAQIVREADEGHAFGCLAKGLFILVISLPLASGASALLSYIAIREPAALSTTTVIKNYVNVVFAVGAFYFIGRGGELLVRNIRAKTNPLHGQGWTLAFMVLGALFSWLVVSHVRSIGRNVTYYLPDWLVVMTLVIPYLYVWYRGIAAAYSMYYYQQRVQGIVYKRALYYVSMGIATVIVTSIFIQFLTVFAERVNRLNLTPVLLLVYALVALYGVGYGMIARGARKLKSIEDA